ncbi:MAG: 50S ribosomal protein L5 [candidate division SR1 bacterium CG_4_9_14_3_um_filter_40_9]|nr:MAG: 50S ribosomal protein L5 [candidate division SR1 bacterium CG_4_9_14_3_um_filter_40_9]
MATLAQFRKEILPALAKKLSIKNVNAVPKLEKVVVAVGIGSLATRKSIKDFDEFEKNLIKITGQKPRITKSKKAISNFKLREGLPVMMQCTLRKERAYSFLDKFVKLVLPRVSDFAGISEKSFDKEGRSINIGLQNYNVFPELGVEDIVTTMGMQVTIVLKSKNASESKALLEALGFIFK